MPLSLYTRNAWLNHVFGNATMEVPSAWYVQLHYGDPGSNCTANAWTDAGRQPITWSTAAAKANAQTLEAAWSSLPNPGTNTQVTWLSIWDAATSGNPLSYGQLVPAVLVGTGGSLTIPVGVITNTVAGT